MIYEALEQKNLIKGKSDIANELGTYNHIINSILKGERNITIDQLNTLFDKYMVNANYVFGISDQMFTENGNVEHRLPIRDLSERNFGTIPNITLVPHKALAGYGLPNATSEDNDDVTKFSVPGLQGDLLAVEISGDSMMPTLTNGDIVICDPVKRGESLNDNHIYVIVSETVVAKRIQQIKENGHLARLRLISDNHTLYQPYELELEEIIQLHKVKCRLTSYGIS
ncbi:MAG: S24 family peptidase [Saprospiraceae bacterium]|nr:S24 family peptidase [Saprospiraceae bacterium]